MTDEEVEAAVREAILGVVRIIEGLINGNHAEDMTGEEALMTLSNALRATAMEGAE